MKAAFAQSVKKSPSENASQISDVPKLKMVEGFEYIDPKAIDPYFRDRTYETLPMLP